MADKLDLAIAQGAPSVNFSPLSSLLGDYVAGRQLAQKVGTIDAFQSGAPTLADGTPDYAAMAQTYQLGDVNTATQLARLAQRAMLATAANGTSPASADQPNPYQDASFMARNCGQAHDRCVQMYPSRWKDCYESWKQCDQNLGPPTIFPGGIWAPGSG